MFVRKSQNFQQNKSIKVNVPLAKSVFQIATNADPNPKYPFARPNNLPDLFLESFGQSLGLRCHCTRHCHVNIKNYIFQ